MTKPPFRRENKPVSENFKAPDHLVDQLVDTDPNESKEQMKKMLVSQVFVQLIT